MLNIYKNMPTIDLHGETRDISKILVRNFIEDNYRLRNEIVVIIHGMGKGIVKTSVYEELKNNKYVKEYKQDNFNPGETIVKLNL